MNNANKILLLEDLRSSTSVLFYLEGEDFIDALTNFYSRVHLESRFKGEIDYLSDIESNRKQYLSFYLSELGDSLEVHYKNIVKNYQPVTVNGRIKKKYDDIELKLHTKNYKYYVLDFYHDLRLLTEYIYQDTNHKNELTKAKHITLNEDNLIKEYLPKKLTTCFWDYQTLKGNVDRDMKISPDYSYEYIGALCDKNISLEAQNNLLSVFTKGKYICAIDKFLSYLFDCCYQNRYPKMVYPSMRNRVKNLSVSYIDNKLDFGNHGFVEFYPEKSPLKDKYKIGHILEILCKNNLKLNLDNLDPSYSINASDFNKYQKLINKAILRDIRKGKLHINAELVRANEKQSYKLDTYRLGPETKYSAKNQVQESLDPVK